MATSDPIYVVTLHKKEDLEGFYTDMKNDGYSLSLKRPISRNTHYHMTDAQAVELRKDSRVWDVEKRPEDLGITPTPFGIVNNTPVTRTNTWRWTGTWAASEDDWGKIQHQGSAVQRRKGTHGYNGVTSSLQTATDTITHFNDGKHVDIVVCDQRASTDCKEWESLSTNVSRFKDYDWYTNLNSYVSSIDDDGVSIPSAPYDQYVDHTTNVNYHGTHVTGTIAGKYYGWAPEADIYSMTILNDQGGHGNGSPVPTYLMFDYLRAFHRYKAVNPTTGRRNPTITNHSWGYTNDLSDDYEGVTFDVGNITSIVWRGVTYNSGNPGPSGWTLTGIESDFCFSSNNGKLAINAHWPGIQADVEDAISDGVVVICASGNNNYYMVPQVDPDTGQQHQDWDNRVTLNGGGAGTYYYCRGTSPGSSPNAITVGCLDNDGNHDRKWFSNYGPAIDVWAAGSMTVSAWGKPGVLKSKDGTALNDGTTDTRHGGNNWLYPISGTSMASPQVAGVAACLATGTDRFTNKDVLNYIQNHSIYNDMTWDDEPTSGEVYNVSPFVDNFSTTAWRLMGTDKDGTISDTTDNPTVNIYRGDYVNFKMPPQSSMGMQITGTSGGKYQAKVLDRSNYIMQSTASDNPTIRMEVGDALDIGAIVDLSSHPVYIKTAATTGTGDQVTTGTTYGQGSASCGWDTGSGTTVVPGTYYYICGNHATMVGEIVVSAAQGLFNHPLYIKTVANDTGTTNQVTGAANQGAVWWDGGNGQVIWGGMINAGTYFYQCGSHASMCGQIVVTNAPGVLHAPGSFADSNCQKGSPDRYLHLKNPRELSGYVGAGFGLHTLKGPRPIHHNANIKPTTSAQVFPRQNTYHTPV